MVKTIHFIDDTVEILDVWSIIFKKFGFKVITYASTDQFYNEYKQEQSEVLLIDVMMAGESGNQMFIKITEMGINTPCIFFTAYADYNLTRSLFKQGAYDVLSKESNEFEILESINKGIKYCEDIRSASLKLNVFKKKVKLLSPKEYEVFKLIIAGDDVKNTSIKLGSAENTISSHRKSIYHKLDIESASKIINHCRQIKYT